MLSAPSAGRLQAGRSSSIPSCSFCGLGRCHGSMLLSRLQGALGRFGCNRDERPDMTYARVIAGGAEIDLDELRRGARAALCEQGRGGRVGSHLGIAVLDEQRREAGEVGARLGDLERDLGRALERSPELLVAIPLLQRLAAAKRVSASL